MRYRSYPFTEKESYYGGLTDEELTYAQKDARAALEVARRTEAEGYRLDDCSTIATELRRRAYVRRPGSFEVR